MYLLELAGEDDAFAAREAAAVATDVTRLAPGLATARGVDTGTRGLAYTHRVSEYVGRADPAVESARALLKAASVERSGTVAVRARDVRGLAGVDTRAAERDLGSVLVDRGFAVDLDDPDHELRAVFAADVCVLGWLDAESVRNFGDRQPTDRPFFQPGSMDPLLARGLANIAGAGPGATILDPMCGTGGVLIEAGLVGADVLGVDAQPKMVQGAAENLKRFLTPAQSSADLPDSGTWHTLRGDATALSLPDDAVDGTVFDAPYGRQSKIANQPLDDLVAGALAEAHRVAPRAVVVADRSWDDAAREAGWRVTDRFERRVHRSLTRHVLVLARANG
ncbi:methyltransferase domain-containing protein [Halorientalis sp.]|uniref:methyltransferase domain-containing protein n=1 Tax=Halorientalis sp. TaxID=1931229 RepID=UPI002617CAFF|nr:methyltransferase domain-containing protein [Halorientalis sp.]